METNELRSHLIELMRRQDIIISEIRELKASMEEEQEEELNGKKENNGRKSTRQKEYNE